MSFNAGYQKDMPEQEGFFNKLVGKINPDLFVLAGTILIIVAYLIAFFMNPFHYDDDFAFYFQPLFDLNGAHIYDPFLKKMVMAYPFGYLWLLKALTAVFYYTGVEYPLIVAGKLLPVLFISLTSFYVYKLGCALNFGKHFAALFTTILFIITALSYSYTTYFSFTPRGAGVFLVAMGLYYYLKRNLFGVFISAILSALLYNPTLLLISGITFLDLALNFIKERKNISLSAFLLGLVAPVISIIDVGIHILRWRLDNVDIWYSYADILKMPQMGPQGRMNLQWLAAISLDNITKIEWWYNLFFSTHSNVPQKPVPTLLGIIPWLIMVLFCIFPILIKNRVRGKPVNFSKSRVMSVFMIIFILAIILLKIKFFSSFLFFVYVSFLVSAFSFYFPSPNVLPHFFTIIMPVAGILLAAITFLSYYIIGFRAIMPSRGTFFSMVIFAALLASSGIYSIWQVVKESKIKQALVSIFTLGLLLFAIVAFRWNIEVPSNENIVIEAAKLPKDTLVLANPTVSDAVRVYDGRWTLISWELTLTPHVFVWAVTERNIEWWVQTYYANYQHEVINFCRQFPNTAIFIEYDRLTKEYLNGWRPFMQPYDDIIRKRSEMPFVFANLPPALQVKQFDGGYYTTCALLKEKWRF